MICEVQRRGVFSTVLEALEYVREVFRSESMTPQTLFTGNRERSFVVHPYHLEAGKLYDTARMVEDQFLA